MREYVPIWEKYNLTVPEASEYFNIGIHKLRAIVSNNRDADYLIAVGSRTLIKRNKFEQFLNRSEEI